VNTSPRSMSAATWAVMEFLDHSVSLIRCDAMSMVAEEGNILGAG
jgi:hypothetical protein